MVGAPLVPDEQRRASPARPPSGPTPADRPSRRAAARSARTPARPGRARPAARRGSRSARGASSSRLSGTPARTSHSVASTSGTLMAKIQRQETNSISAPPPSGPSTNAIPVHAVHEPIAAPRSSPGKTAVISARLEGTSSAPADALQRARHDQRHGVRRDRAQRRGDAEADQPPDEHAPAAEDVAERAADQDQRAEREQVGLDDPLLLGEARCRGPPGSPAARR